MHAKSTERCEWAPLATDLLVVARTEAKIHPCDLKTFQLEPKFALIIELCVSAS